MKIGFSFGRCVRDIVKGDVDIKDVMCVIARTYMPKEEHVKEVVAHYLYEPTYLRGLDPVRCEEVGLELYRSGRIIEPRQNGIHVTSAPRDCVWMDLYPTVVGARNEAVRQAWEGYRMLIELAEQVPEANGEELMHRNKSEAHDQANRVPPTPEQIEENRKLIELLANSI
jgi:hypothetical protein